MLSTRNYTATVEPFAVLALLALPLFMTMSLVAVVLS